MADFTQPILTNIGKEIIASATAGDLDMTFTRIVLSDFDYTSYEKEELENLIILENVRQTTNIERVSVDGTKVKVEGNINNSNVTNGYFIRAVGIYVLNSAGDEVLFRIKVARTPDFIAPFNGFVSTGIAFEDVFEITNSDNVTIIVDPDSYAKIDDLQKVEENLTEDINNVDSKINTLMDNVVLGTVTGTAVDTNDFHITLPDDVSEKILRMQNPKAFVSFRSDAKGDDGGGNYDLQGTSASFIKLLNDSFAIRIYAPKTNHFYRIDYMIISIV